MNGQGSHWPVSWPDLASKPSRFHHAGFTRFQLTELSKVLNHPLRLASFCADGKAIEGKHYIVAEKHDHGSLSFAATLRPLTVNS